MPGIELRAVVPTSKVMPPCQGACPIHQDIRGYIASIAQGRFAEAVGIIRETNPLPFICGYICAHPCETECRRGDIDEPLSIRSLKRFALEHGGEEHPGPVAAARPQRVAIIGSGPAGLTAAHDLVRMGYRVTVFEREEEPGGALSQVLPVYRLPAEVIRRDINFLASLGVEIRTGTALGRDFSLDDLEGQGYNAVLLSMGLPLSRKLPLPGIDHPDVLLALPFLKAARQGKSLIRSGANVIVIGGGNVAIDVARVARRLGAGIVRIVCLESREEMPAYPWEIEEAIEEGIKVEHCRWGPNRILIEDGRIVGMECKRCLAVFDEQGRFNPRFCEEELTTVEGDTVILAIGQASETGFLKDMGVALDARGQVRYDPDTMATSRPGVFACGEMVTGPGTAVQAMANGRRAALAIARYLEGVRGPLPPDRPIVMEDLTEEARQKVKRQPRREMPKLSAAERADNFRLLELGYREEQALQEATRCLSCGATEVVSERCVSCLTCLRVCPYDAPAIARDGVLEIRRDRCQACGICVAECPMKAIIYTCPGQADIVPRMEAALQELEGQAPAVLGLYCSYHTYRDIGYTRFLDSLPRNVRPITAACLAKVDIAHLLSAFEKGADGVLLIGCADAECRFEKAAAWIRQRVAVARRYLEEAGLGGERVKLYQLSVEDLPGFNSRLGEILEEIKQMGPNPLRSRRPAR